MYPTKLRILSYEYMWITVIVVQSSAEMHRYFTTALVSLTALCGTQAGAEGESFTAADVVAWDQTNQDWYFEVATSMGAALASQNSSEQARCINDWYFKDEASRSGANGYIRDVMGRFPSYHPTLVMISILEKQCGSLTFTD